MKILHSTHSAPAYIPPPALAPGQIVCGPLYPNQSIDGRVLSVRTPHGEYDIAQVMDRIPPEQRPDLLIVRADASGLNMPRNVAAARCPAVLVVGDTHHMRNPIGRLLLYACAETFAAVIIDYTRQHGHFFIEAGLPR